MLILEDLIWKEGDDEQKESVEKMSKWSNEVDKIIVIKVEQVELRQGHSFFHIFP